MQRLTFSKRWLFLLAISACAFALTTGNASASFDVTDYGAAGDGETLDTPAIQKAVDRCAKQGGGTVHLPAGTYLSGTIHLRSHVTLHLAAGATLLGSTSLEHYPENAQKLRSYTENYVTRSLIYGEKLENVSITGRGTIDGQGASFADRFGSTYKKRPYIMRLIECEDVLVENVTIRNSPMWVQHYLGCRDVALRGITVKSRVAANNDGININSCRNVRISDCHIVSGDDAIVLKSSSKLPTKHVTITNCVLSSHCNAFKLGTESNGGFQDIAVSNLVIYDTRLAGIALEEVDGGTLVRVGISNVVMRDVGCALFLRLGNRARPYPGQKKPGMGAMHDVMISNVQATGVGTTGGSITGQPGHPMQNVTLSNIRISHRGGGTLEDARREVPMRPEDYPEFSMFGRLPSYGLFVRHVEGLHLYNVHLDFAKSDLRPAVVLKNASEVELGHVSAERASNGKPSVVARENVSGLTVYNSPRLEITGLAPGSETPSDK